MCYYFVFTHRRSAETTAASRVGEEREEIDAAAVKRREAKRSEGGARIEKTVGGGYGAEQSVSAARSLVTSATPGTRRSRRNAPSHRWLLRRQ